MEDIETLFRLYADDMYRLAYSYLRSRSDAEDVCQTVFLKLAEKRIPLAPGKEKHWLLKCTANASRSCLRSFWRRNVDPVPEEPEGGADAWPENSPEARLQAAVTQLPKPYRMAVHLYYYEGYDQREIAAILGISRSAVQTRMARARQMLKKEMEEDV